MYMVTKIMVKATLIDEIQVESYDDNNGLFRDVKDNFIVRIIAHGHIGVVAKLVDNKLASLTDKDKEIARGRNLVVEEVGKNSFTCSHCEASMCILDKYIFVVRELYPGNKYVIGKVDDDKISPLSKEDEEIAEQLGMNIEVLSKKTSPSLRIISPKLINQSLDFSSPMDEK